MDARNAITPPLSSATADLIASASPNTAKLVLLWLASPPVVQEAVIEEMRQIVAVQKDCRPRVPTHTELSAELAR